MKNKLISLLAGVGLVALIEGCNLNKYSNLEKAYNNLPPHWQTITSSNPRFHYEMINRKYKIEKIGSEELGKVIRLDHTYYEPDEMEIMCEFNKQGSPECKVTVNHHYCLNVYIFEKVNGEWDYLTKSYISLSYEEALKFFEEFINDSKKLKAVLGNELADIKNIDEDLCINYNITEVVSPPDWAKRKR